jgi:hypothetical protein
MLSSRKIEDRYARESFSKGFPAVPGSFPSVLSRPSPDASYRAPVDILRERIALDKAAARRLVQRAAEPAIHRWPQPARLALLLSSAVLAWTLFMLLARMAFG